MGRRKLLIGNKPLFFSATLSSPNDQVIHRLVKERAAELEISMASFLLLSVREKLQREGLL